MSDQPQPNHPEPKKRFYELDQSNVAPYRLATNRQKKLLRFFGVKFGPFLSFGAAGWEIRKVLSEGGNSDLWARYVFLTGDLSEETEEPVAYDPLELRAVGVPKGWTIAKAFQKKREAWVEQMLGNDESPFDEPAPPVQFQRRTFVLTGKFAFGSRKKCAEALVSRGGEAPDLKNISALTDYLVVGSLGSPQFKFESYGTKIQNAVYRRRNEGSPAIISEEHWAIALNQTER
jgi:NAD-dependent DNA ligase